MAGADRARMKAACPRASLGAPFARLTGAACLPIEWSLNQKPLERLSLLTTESMAMYQPLTRLSLNGFSLDSCSDAKLEGGFDLSLFL